MKSVFELIMLVCFGISWPFSVYKSWKSRSVQGKSLIFLLAIWIGYVSGILHKVFFSPDFVILVYAFNLTLVTLDLILYFINSRRDPASRTSLSARQK
jgi:hypothetical protein